MPRRKLYTPDESVHTPQSKAKKKLKPKSGSVKRRRPGLDRKRVRPGSSGVKRRSKKTLLLQRGGRGR